MMFQSAIEAAAAAAAAWTPECADPVGGHGCCPLCLHRYRHLVLNGPLRDLPHPVAHAAIEVVDAIVSEQVDSALDGLRWATWVALVPEQDRELELQQRVRSAGGALTLAALEELSRAEWRFSELRGRWTEPAVEAYLVTHRMTEVPRQWET